MSSLDAPRRRSETLIGVALVAFFSIVASLAFAPPADATTFTGVQHCVVNVPSYDALNLRAGPSVANPIIAEMPPGSCNVYVNEGRSGSWYNVSYDGPWGPVSGWAHSAYLQRAPRPPIIDPPIPPPPPRPRPPRPVPIPPVQPGPEWCVDAPRHLNLRSGPSTGYHVIARVSDGDCSIVQIGPNLGRWRKVQWLNGGGQIGWMHARFLRPAYFPGPVPPPYPVPVPPPYPIPIPPVPPPPELLCVTGTPGYDSLNLRSGPGTGYAVLTSMPHGSCPLSLDAPSRNGWVQVNYRGITGWAYGRYLTPGPVPVLVLD